MEMKKLEVCSGIEGLRYSALAKIRHMFPNSMSRKFRFTVCQTFLSQSY